MIDKHDILKNNPFSITQSREKVFIYYNGKQIMTLKDSKALKLLSRIEKSNDLEEQLFLAKITGHFKH